MIKIKYQRCMAGLVNIYRMACLSTALTLALFLASCEFEPAEKYIVNLDKPGAGPPINVDITLLTDTVSLYTGSEISVRIDAGNLKVRGVRFFLDGVEVTARHTGSKYYVILNFSQPDIHKFSMIIDTNTGTGSIADKLGLEEFQYPSREWTLVVKNCQTLSNLSCMMDNKDLLFNWGGYDGFDFKLYRLKELSTGNSYDISDTTFRLSTYAGEGGYYDLYVVDNDNFESLWGRCSLDKSLPLLRIGNVNDQVALIWNNTIFSDNIAEYRLYQQLPVSGWTYIATFQTGDTAFLLQGNDNIFGERVSFYLFCEPKYYTNIENPSIFNTYLEAYAALPGPMYGSNYYGASCRGFYFDRYSPSSAGYVLYRYSIAADQVDSLMDFKFWWNFSPNARYLLYSQDSIMNLYDLSANVISGSKNFKSFTSNFYPWAGLYVSDNGICVFALDNVLYVYDFLKDKLITSENMHVNALKISPDGQYFTATRNDSLLIYRINENSVSIVTGAVLSNGSYSYTDYDFCANNSDNLFYYESPLLYVRSCQDLSVVRSFNIGESFNNIDFCSGKVLSARTGGDWEIHDFYSGELLQSIKCRLSIGCSNCLVLTDNIIFAPGYKYILHD